MAWCCRHVLDQAGTIIFLVAKASGPHQRHAQSGIVGEIVNFLSPPPPIVICPKDAMGHLQEQTATLEMGGFLKRDVGKQIKVLLLCR